MNSNKSKKVAKIVLNILSIIVILIVLTITLFVLIMKAPIHKYYEYSTREFNMPGQNEGLINQGIDYDERTNSLFFVGYRSGSQPSSLYIYNLDTKNQKRIDLNDKDGNTFSGHSGGVCVYGDYIYLAGSSDGCVYVYSYKEAIDCENKGKINCLGHYVFKSANDKIRVSFVSKIEDGLVVGEYCKTNGLSYNTKESHHVQTADGERGGLCIFVKFSNDSSSIFGLENVPSKAFIVPDITQGITYYDEYLFASCSSGLSKSTIYTFDMKNTKQSGTINTLGNDLPLYIFDSSNLVSSVKIPPMSEEIVIVDGKMYIACESASSKYIFGILLGANKIYSTDISLFIKK